MNSVDKDIVDRLIVRAERTKLELDRQVARNEMEMDELTLHIKGFHVMNSTFRCPACQEVYNGGV